MRASRYQTDTADPSQFAPGQRWVSETQAEFGLALILQADQTIVQAFFPAVGRGCVNRADMVPPEHF